MDDEGVAIDGSKFRAQNSKKNNYNAKKVDQHLDYINRKTDEYLDALDRLEENESPSEVEMEQQQILIEKIDHLQNRKEKYEGLQDQIDLARQEGETQVSTTDPDARALPKKMNIVEVSYNALIAVEKHNKLITNFEIDNKNDTYALTALALGARKVLDKKPGEPLWVLADKGFDTGSELQQCIENDCLTLVAPKARVSPGKDKRFNKEAFDYDVDKDHYICPQGHYLTTNGNWYKKNNGAHRRAYKVKHYKLPFATCRDCPFAESCAGKANLKNSKGRYIERSEYQEYIDENTERVKLNKPLYRQRQAIVEHPFGTIKRGWGFDHTLLKTKEKVAGEFAVIFTAYNLRRAVSILGVKELIERLHVSFSEVKSFLLGFLSGFRGYLFLSEKWKINYYFL